MKIVITGASSGIGLSAAREYLDCQHIVIGIDVSEAAIQHKNYTHYVCDVGKDELPQIPGVNVLVNNAGTVDESKAIETNLVGYIRVAEKYAYQPEIKSVLNIASISAHTGIDGPRYSSSQGGRIAYTKYLTMYLGRLYKATVNSISPGAVKTNLEPDLYKRNDLMKMVAEQNIFKRWIDSKEIAKLIYYMTINNESITGQDIIIDAGEYSNYNFISV